MKADSIILQVILLGVSYFQFTRGQNATVICLSVPGDSTKFMVVFRFTPESVTGVTGLESFTASENPDFVTVATGTGCSTTTETNGAFEVQYVVDVDDPLPCGLEAGTGNTYNGVISPIGLATYYTFSCDTDNLDLPYILETSYSTAHLAEEVTFLESGASVKFQVVQGHEAYVPISEVLVGEPIKLRVTYNDGKFPSDGGAPDLWGSSFHVHPPLNTFTSAYIEIYTPGLGTRVTVTGILSGSEIDQTFVVKRGVPAKLDIPSTYATSATLTSWTKETKGLKIVAQDDVVGVRVTQNSQSYIAFPDDILSDEHRIAAGEGDTNYITVVATEDMTSVFLRYANYDKTGLTVDGSGAADNQVVMLNEMETLHIVCDRPNCYDIDLLSTRNIAVIAGGMLPMASSFSASPFLLQIPAKQYLDTDFIVFATPPGGSALTHYFFTDDEDSTASVATSSTTSETDTFQETSSLAGHRVSSDTPLYGFIQGVFSSPTNNDLTLLPSRRQWSRRNFFYFEETYQYELAVAAFDEAIDAFELISSTSTTTLTLTTTTATAAAGVPDTAYVMGYFDLTILDSGLYEVRAPKPFMAIARESDGTVASNLLSFGTLFPTINPCVTSTTVHPGNGQDDDCDGFVDEELPDGQDDEPLPDWMVDEDVTFRDDAAFIGIKVVSLEIATIPDFSDSEQVHTAGCNSNPADSYLAIIHPFERKTDLSSVFDDLWVLDTPVFRAFRYRHTRSLYYRVVFETCAGDAAVCQSCTGEIPMARRSIEPRKHHLDFMLKFRDTPVEEETDQEEEECETTTIFWVPHILLLAIIVVESTTSGYFLYKKFKLKAL